MLDTRPASVGLMMRCLTWPAGEPERPGETFHRTLSPTFTLLTISPGCSARSHTWSGAQTTVGSVARYSKRMTPSSPRCGISARPAHRRANVTACRSLAFNGADGDTSETGGGMVAGAGAPAACVVPAV